jgi:hypothetical protein
MATISDDVGLTLQAKLTPAYCDDFLGPHLIITLPIGNLAIASLTHLLANRPKLA